MNINVVYIISQIVTVIYYGFLCASFLIKERDKILFTNFLAHFGQAIAMGLLGGYTGACMSIVMMLRDLVFYITEKMKKSGKNVDQRIDSIVFVFSIIVIIAFTIFTYNGIFSLLSVVATLTSTIAVWQKNTKVYRWLGFIGGILWLMYEIYIFSIMGIILELTLITSTVIGNIKNK